MLKIKKLKKAVSLILILMLLFIISQNSLVVFASDEIDCEVDLTNLKYTIISGTENEITTYAQDDYEQFVIDFASNNLPEIYITEFLYDGAGMVKTPDLDDFTDTEGSGNDTKIKTLSIKAINVNTTGNIQFSGEIAGGMIAVNTNNIAGDINLILNGVNIDTDSKKTPAIYVYNRNINYTEHKVTIKTVSGTNNYIEGGKFKKVSLIGSDKLDEYTKYYSGTAKTNYETYTTYYGIYTSEQIENILFAKVQADNEDLSDGDPYYFYKGAGAISSDIDLYFEGEGYLSIISKNKEGIETKGNLTFSGGKGDYYILAEDDCLNTTTSSQGNSAARNTLTIDVKSLTAIVDKEADEGDAIDSNGTLIINGGRILAFAHPTTQDDGLDSEKGTYINEGTVLAIGNMSDAISNNSEQEFLKLNFQNQQEAETLICITTSDGTPIMAFKSDRTFKTLTYSSPSLTKQTYNVYKNGTIEGTEENGLYTNIESYSGGTLQQWTSGSGQPGDNGQEPMGPPNNQDQDQNLTPPEKPNGDQNMTPPDQNTNNQNLPEKPNAESNNMQDSKIAKNNKDFTVDDSTHTFDNVTDYTGESSDSNSTTDLTTAKVKLPNTGVNIMMITILTALISITIILYVKSRKIKY